jgi:hypothetical protein
LQIGDRISILKKELFDGSITLQLKSKKEVMLTHQVAERILVDTLNSK